MGTVSCGCGCFPVAYIGSACLSRHFPSGIPAALAQPPITHRRSSTSRKALSSRTAVPCCPFRAVRHPLRRLVRSSGRFYVESAVRRPSSSRDVHCANKHCAALPAEHILRLQHQQQQPPESLVASAARGQLGTPLGVKFSHLSRSNLSYERLVLQN